MSGHNGFMPRIIALAGLTLTLVLTLLSLSVLSWAHYGQYDFALYRFPGWPVHATSALALQAIVAWTVFRPASPASRWPRLIAGIACALAAAGSAIVLGSHYDRGPDFFPDVIPMVMPSPGLGPFVAVLAALVSAGGLVQAHAVRSRPALPLQAGVGGIVRG